MTDCESELVANIENNYYGRGLCGILNEAVEDDFTDLKGRQAIRPDLFAHSWTTDFGEKYFRIYFILYVSSQSMKKIKNFVSK